MVKTTEGIIPFIQRMADGKPVDRPDLIPNADKFMKLMEEATKGMFDRGKLYMRPNKDGIWRTYMIQQPMETHNID